MKAVQAAAVAVVSLLMSGCASSLMHPAPSEHIAVPGTDKAKVVFMRTSFVAGAIGCDLFEVVNGELRFIGQLPYGNKVVYETTPGDKVFMAYGTAADLWNAGTRLLEPNEDAPAWFRDNKARMQAIYAEYWRRFETKTDQEKAFRTLMPEDGR